MKYILVGLLIIHGLIHLIGFVKAFGLAQSSVIQAFIPRSVGLVWLATALLLIISGIVLAAGMNWWWLMAAIGVVFSQILIFSTWSDAKAGTIPNVILILPIVVAALSIAPWNYRAMYNRDVADRISQQPASIKILTEADLALLPRAVQRYLEFTRVVNKPQVWNYRLRFEGEFRMRPNDKWMRTTADQQNFTGSPARLFLMDASMFGIPFTAYHRNVDGQATFRVKLASLLSVTDARGPEMNQSETVTLLNDMFFLAPASLIDQRISWEELDPLTVRATFTNAGNTVSAIVYFDSSGALVNFISDDRYMTSSGKTYELHRWSTPVREWRELDGRMLPTIVETAWDLSGEEFVYGRFEIIEVQYNLTAP